MAFPDFKKIKEHPVWEFWDVLLVTATLPWPILTSNIAIIAMCLNQIWKIARVKEKFNFSPVVPLISFGTLLVLSISGLALSEDTNSGVYEAEKQIAFLVFPLLLPRINARILHALLLLFSISFVSRLLISLYSIEYNLTVTDLYTKLPLHYPYFGIYATIPGLYFLWCFFNRPGKVSSLLLFLSFTGLTLISSGRNAISFFAISVGILILIALRTYTLRILFLLLYCVALYFGQAYLGRFSNFSDALSVKELSWQCSIEALDTREKWLLGVGTGNAQDALQTCYCNHQSWFCDVRYDSHNQYLTFLLTNGLGSLIAFLLLIGSCLYIAIRTRSTMLFLVALSLAISSISESVFLMNKGIVFYTFWICLLLKQVPDSKEIQSKTT